MSINYSIAMLGNPIDEDAPKKAYAKSQYTNILTLDKFAGHIASHGSKYNRADIYAVLMQTVDCMREMLLEGKRIEMGDLGVFSISIQSRGAENLETFNPAIHIEQLNVNWTPGDRFRNLLEDAVFNLVPSRRAARILLKSIKAGETTVDLTGGEGGGNEANQPTEGQGVTRPGRTVCPFGNFPNSYGELKFKNNERKIIKSHGRRFFRPSSRRQSPPSPHWASPAAQPFLSAYDRGILPPVHRR